MKRAFEFSLVERLVCEQCQHRMSAIIEFWGRSPSLSYSRDLKQRFAPGDAFGCTRIRQTWLNVAVVFPFSPSVHPRSLSVGRIVSRYGRTLLEGVVKNRYPVCWLQVKTSVRILGMNGTIQV